MPSISSPCTVNGAGQLTAPSGGLGFASVLHVNEKGGRFGGTEEYITLLAAGLARRGVRSHLACGVLVGDPPSGLDSVHVIEGLASRRPVGGVGGRLLELIGVLAPDVVYVHNVFDPAVVSILAAVEGRGPLLWYVHDHFVSCLSELRWRRDIGCCEHRLGAGCLEAISAERCVLRHPQVRFAATDVTERRALAATLATVDAVIVVSEYMRGLLCDAEPRVERRLHHLVRPVRQMTGPSRRARRRPGAPVVVTYAGRINAEKGLATVLEALATTTSDRPLEFRIAGVVEDPEYWSRCQMLARNARAQRRGLRIAYLGHVDYDAIDRQLCESDIVVVPSLWPEPLGAVAAEAMTAGAAVIASQVGGLHDVITDGDDGILAPPGDVAAWRSALDSLIEDDSVRARLGKRARRATAIRTVERHIDALDRIIADICGSHDREGATVAG